MADKDLSQAIVWVCNLLLLDKRNKIQFVLKLNLPTLFHLILSNSSRKVGFRINALMTIIMNRIAI